MRATCFHRVCGVVFQHLSIGPRCRGVVVLLGTLLILLDAPTAQAQVVVTTTADNTTAGDGDCTLREAITNANNDNDSTSGDCAAGFGTDEINFNIPGAGPHTIQPTSALPDIIDAVVIDGETQIGASCGTDIPSRTLLVELDGSGAGAGVNGLVLASGSDGSTIRGLVVNQWEMANGIFINGSDSNVVECNFIGTNIDGTADLGNNTGVVAFAGSSGNMIGGTTAGAGNVISGNDFSGVDFFDSGTTGNRVEGNLIGTDISGTADLGNFFQGVLIRSGASNNTIGGIVAGAGNVISGNGGGVFMDGSGTTGNRVEGNLIGTDISGTAALGNAGGGGVTIQSGASLNTIGGTAAGAGNVISANGAQGIVIFGSGTTGNLVEGNLIGTDITGTAALGNGLAGVIIAIGASNNTIGGTSAGAGNVISSNNYSGVRIIRGATGNRVEGNLVGTDISGAAALGNAFDGVEIASGASNNTIGGTEDGAANTIAFNGQDGVVLIVTAGTGNAIQGNSLFSNGELGIDLNNDGVTANDPGDVDSGPNNLQNFPVITNIDVDDDGNLLVTYRVDTDTANATYPLTVEFFVADADNQEGEIFIGSDTYTVGNYNVCGTPPCEKTKTLNGPPVPTLVATATDDDGNTSEFSSPTADLELTVEVLSITIISTDANPEASGKRRDIVRVRMRTKTRNRGPNRTKRVQTTFSIDPEYVVTVVDLTQGTFDTNTGIWDIGTLEINDEVINNLTLEATLPDDGQVTFNTTVEITRSSVPDPDSVPNNAAPQEDDIATVTEVDVVASRRNPLFESDVSLTHSVDQATPAPGETITFTVTATNDGPHTTAGVKVTSLLPEGLAFVSATMSDSTDRYDPATGLWLVGHFVLNWSSTLQLEAQVTGTGAITHTARVTSNNLPDPTSANNQADVTITVQTANARAVGGEQEGEATPTTYTLGPNYPNPFNPETVIPFALPEAAHVTLRVYDVLGREVEVLLDEQLLAGRHQVTWRADHLPTGVYLVRMEAAGAVYSLRLTLMK